MDDAALLYPPQSTRGLVYTMDVITPIVDDPTAFGRIAAANSLSDVYAMGGKPQVALSFVGMPDALGLDVLTQVIQGMAEKAIEAGCAIVGGHTIKDSEPKCGLAVIGSTQAEPPWTHTHARAGQVLVLTKPIGTGVIAQAIRQQADLPESDIREAVRWMETLNQKACAVGLECSATAATDVTGFGLLGHLFHMAQGSQLCAVLDAAAVPLLSGAYESAAKGWVPGGSKRNLKYVEPHLRQSDHVDPTRLLLLADAQTSGGLLLSIPPEHVEKAITLLPFAAVIGVWEREESGTIRFQPQSG